MFVHKSARWLLGHLLGFKLFTIYEVTAGEDWFVLGLSLERDVFHSHDVDL